MQWKITTVSQLFATVKTVGKNGKLRRFLQKLERESGKMPMLSFEISLYTGSVIEPFVKRVENKGGKAEEIKRGNTYKHFRVTIGADAVRDCFGTIDLYDFLIKEQKVQIVVGEDKTYTMIVNPLVFIYCSQVL